MKNFYSLSLTSKKSRNREGKENLKNIELKISVNNGSESSANKIKFQKIKNDLEMIQNNLRKFKEDLQC